MNDKQITAIVITGIIGVLLAIASFFGGMAVGSIAITKAAFKGLDYADNINIIIDVNETDMVNAMLPYIPKDSKPSYDITEAKPIQIK